MKLETDTKTIINNTLYTQEGKRVLKSLGLKDPLTLLLSPVEALSQIHRGKFLKSIELTVELATTQGKIVGERVNIELIKNEARRKGESYNLNSEMLQSKHLHELFSQIEKLHSKHWRDTAKLVHDTVRYIENSKSALYERDITLEDLKRIQLA